MDVHFWLVLFRVIRVFINGYFCFFPGKLGKLENLVFPQAANSKATAKVFPRSELCDVEATVSDETVKSQFCKLYKFNCSETI